MECFRILNDGLPLGCTLNPILGREFEYGEEKLCRNGNGKKVAVIGGGPAGMQAAVVLAKRGFKTYLFEASDRLGGTVNLAALPPNKGMLAEFVETQQAEIEKAGVEVKLNCCADVNTLKELGVEAVFLATGGKAIRPNIEGIEKAVTAEDVLAGKAEVNGELVIIGGGVTGLETAELLGKDHKVTVVEMLDKVGGNLYPSVTMHLVQEIMKQGGQVCKSHALVKVNDGSVTVRNTKTNEEVNISADTVVLAMGVRSERANISELCEAYGDNVVLVGDADKPGQIYDALHSAYNRAFVFELQ
jgi:pyruvate/2-oxoglutarate dehydrogenase complex dihydrolipoamide dehydrogenase (E3) component